MKRLNNKVTCPILGCNTKLRYIESSYPQVDPDRFYCDTCKITFSNDRVQGIIDGIEYLTDKITKQLRNK